LSSFYAKTILKHLQNFSRDHGGFAAICVPGLAVLHLHRWKIFVRKIADSVPISARRHRHLPWTAPQIRIFGET
jgi:hypothetical protein